jgi:predicted transposase YdaD
MDRHTGKGFIFEYKLMQPLVYSHPCMTTPADSLLNTSQPNLIAASGILAGLQLDEDVIYRILRRDIMQESSVYQSILAEGEVKKQREIASNSLREGLLIATVARIMGLSVEELQQIQQQVNESSQI